MSNPFRVVLRIGQDYVASNVHYKDKDSANAARNQLLSSATFRSLPQGQYGVRVMHWSTFKKICDKGFGVTVAKLKENETRYGREVASASSLFKSYDALYDALKKEYE